MLVHGEPKAQEELAGRIQERFGISESRAIGAVSIGTIGQNVIDNFMLVRIVGIGDIKADLIAG